VIDPRFTVVGFPGWRELQSRLPRFAISPLGHVFLDRLHVRPPPATDLGPGVTGE
jgi:hypothetical protein